MNSHRTDSLVYLDADDGVSYRVGPDDSATAIVKISPQTTGVTEFSLTAYRVQPGATLTLDAYRWIDRLFFGLAGNGNFAAGGEEYAIGNGATAFVGRGHQITFRNDSPDVLEFFVASYPPGPESRTDLLVEDGNGLRMRELTATERDLLGVADAQAAQDGSRGIIRYVASNDGDSFWQADPSAGYVTVKLAPHNFHINQFAVLAQLLEPGAYVRQHGHASADELIIIGDGEGFARIDGQNYPLRKGTLVLLGRNLIHGFHNTGEENLVLLGTFNPPGIEGALSETGVKRVPGEARPQGIPRNAETGKLLVERYGFILPAGGG